jgi:hypothetical protein
MLFSLRSIVLFSSAIAASLAIAARPLDCAVPTLFVPGGGEADRDVAPADAGALVLCANEATGDIKITIAVTADVTDSLCIGNLLLPT